MHNCLIAHDRVFLSAHSGINFWIGNNPDANGYPRFPPGLHAGQAAMLQDSIDAAESAAGHPLKRGRGFAYWSAKARNYINDIRRHGCNYLRSKSRNFWSAFQYDDLSIITILREQKVTLPGIYFGLVAAPRVTSMVLGMESSAARALGRICIALQCWRCCRYSPRNAIVCLLFRPSYFRRIRVGHVFHNLVAGKFRWAIAYAAFLIVSSYFISWPQRESILWALDAYSSGWQALESGNLPLAERKLQLACAYVPTNPETNFALGNLRLAEGNSAAASTFYLTTLQLDDSHRGALNNLGVIALDHKQFELAEHWFRRALDLNTRSAKTHFLLAKTYAARGDRADASAEIDSAVALSPQQPEFRQLREEIQRQ